MYASSSAVPSQRYLFAIGAILVAVLTGGWFLNQWQAQRELLALPAQERQTLYEHTLETLQTVCMHAKSAELNDYCREQVQFISSLPECTTTCQDVCKKLTPQPTK